MDCSICGTPAAGEPSRAGAVRDRGGLLADMLGAPRPVYLTPSENLRAAQAAVDEMGHLEGDELRCMTQRARQLLDAVATQQEARRRVSEVAAHAGNRPLRREQGATSRSPTVGATNRRDSEPAASRSRQTRFTIERDGDGRPRAVERRGEHPPPPRRERRVSPPPVDHPSQAGCLGRREGVGENDARHRLDRLARSQTVEEEDDLCPACFGPRIRNEPFPKGFSLPETPPSTTDQ